MGPGAGGQREAQRMEKQELFVRQKKRANGKLDYNGAKAEEEGGQREREGGCVRAPPRHMPRSD
jgi:hypothetical protein